MVFPLILGLKEALGSAMAILSAFHKTSVTTVIGTGGGDGFWKFYSYSSVSKRSIHIDKMWNYILDITDRVIRDSPYWSGQHQSISEDFASLLAYEDWGSGTQVINTYYVNNYDNLLNRVHLYIFLIDPPIDSTVNGQKYYPIHSMHLKIDAKFALPYLITHKFKSSFLKTSGKIGIQYLPDPGYSFQKCVEGLRIALAPIVLGLVPAKEFLQEFVRLISSIDANTKQAQLDYGSQQTANQNAQVCINNQEAGRQRAYDALRPQDPEGIADPKKEGAKLQDK